MLPFEATSYAAAPCTVEIRPLNDTIISLVLPVTYSSLFMGTSSINPSWITEPSSLACFSASFHSSSAFWPSDNCLEEGHVSSALTVLGNAIDAAPDARHNIAALRVIGSSVDLFAIVTPLIISWTVSKWLIWWSGLVHWCSCIQYMLELQCKIYHKDVSNECCYIGGRCFWAVYGVTCSSLIGNGLQRSSIAAIALGAGIDEWLIWGQ